MRLTENICNNNLPARQVSNKSEVLQWYMYNKTCQSCSEMLPMIKYRDHKHIVYEYICTQNTDWAYLLLDNICTILGTDFLQSKYRKPNHALFTVENIVCARAYCEISTINKQKNLHDENNFYDVSFFFKVFILRSHFSTKV